MFLKNYFTQLGKDILIRFPRNIFNLWKFYGDWLRFKKCSDNRFTTTLKDLHPCLSDKTTLTPFDQHYIYHPAWAARILAKTKPEYHVDISSLLNFSTIISAFVPVKFYDYRPAHLSLNNLELGHADLKNLFFESNSIPSLSCMHTIEHIGLGRYGDELDPLGDVKSIAELKRVVKPNGNLLIVVPVGKPKIAFNAHRIYSFEQILEYFSPFSLAEFSLIPDYGGLINNANPELVQFQSYGCGCFWFKKNEPHV